MLVLSVYLWASNLILVLILILNIHAHRRMVQDCITTNCSPDGSVLLRLEWKYDLQFWLLKYFIVQKDHNYQYVICWYRKKMLIIRFLYEHVWRLKKKNKKNEIASMGFIWNICVIFLIHLRYLCNIVNCFREWIHSLMLAKTQYIMCSMASAEWYI